MHAGLLNVLHDAGDDNAAMLLAQRIRAQRGGARTGVHAGLLDVLHDAADDDIAVLVARRIWALCRVAVKIWIGF